MSDRFQRLEMLVGNEVLNTLAHKHVLVIGIGGVGGYVVENLVRNGIGSITIIDHDRVDITNINRQIIAMDSTIGKYKVDVMKERINDINPSCKVYNYNDFVNSDNINSYLEDIDFVVDACDTVDTKKCIINSCLNNDIGFISCMGTAKKVDPSKLSILDIRKTINDPLARIMRKYVKDEKINKKVMVLSSCEVPVKKEGLPSSSFVPNSAGILIARYVVNKLIER